MLSHKLVSIYEKEDNQVFKSKVKNWRLKFVYKNLKGLDYQPDQSQQSDKLKLPKWVKVSKGISNEILSLVTEAKNNKLKTRVDKKEFTLDNAESLLKGLVSGKIDGNEGKERYNKIVDDVNAILKAKITKS